MATDMDMDIDIDMGLMEEEIPQESTMATDALPIVSLEEGIVEPARVLMPSTATGVPK